MRAGRSSRASAAHPLHLLCGPPERPTRRRAPRQLAKREGKRRDVRLSVPSPPRVTRYLPSGEKAMQLVVVPLSCALSQLCRRRARRRGVSASSERRRGEASRAGRGREGEGGSEERESDDAQHLGAHSCPMSTTCGWRRPRMLSLRRRMRASARQPPSPFATRAASPQRRRPGTK